MTVTQPLRRGSGVDLVALVLGQPGERRADSDLVFFNQREHPAGIASCLPDPAPGVSALAVNLARARHHDARVVVAASGDAAPFDAAVPVVVTVTTGQHQVVLDAELHPAGGETALVLLELYRRGEVWKVRAVGQGYPTGLQGLVTDYGFEVDAPPDPPPVPPAVPRPPGPRWAAPRPDHASRSLPPAPPLPQPPGFGQPPPVIDPSCCPRCRRPYSRWISLSRDANRCKHCVEGDRQQVSGWVSRVAAILPAAVPTDLRSLWADIGRAGVDPAEVRRALRPIALAHLRAQVGIAFADGIIEDRELDQFDAWVGELRVGSDAEVASLRMRMVRGQYLSRLEAGDLPRISAAGLHLASADMVHLDVHQATYIRMYAGGPRHHQGRLVITRGGVTFTGVSGHTYPWQRAVSAYSSGGTLVVSTTLVRGEYLYHVPDAELAAAMATGALRLSQRLVLAPGQDTRRIPQLVRTAVWQRDGGACVQCQSTNCLEYDHVIPYSRGGATSEANLQLLCRACNAVKGARI
ncbi:TerD family protein [Rhodococcus sp. X156]|uniref:TerD family protein n=1 Tax=Rhodococcus sp. X156 TaxID=2499145 RepID=UPI0013E34B47|nr:TerD family protein [Rhodococcus sp. X156]